MPNKIGGEKETETETTQRHRQRQHRDRDGDRDRDRDRDRDNTETETTQRQRPRPVSCLDPWYRLSRLIGSNHLYTQYLYTKDTKCHSTSETW